MRGDGGKVLPCLGWQPSGTRDWTNVLHGPYKAHEPQEHRARGGGIIPALAGEGDINQASACSTQPAPPQRHSEDQRQSSTGIV